MLSMLPVIFLQRISSEGLSDVVVHLGLDGFDDLGFLGFRREEDERCVFGRGVPADFGKVVPSVWACSSPR